MNSEPMLWPKVATEPGLRNAIAVVAATLLPGTVVRLPASGAMLLPGAALDTLPLLRTPCRWLMVPLGLGVRLLTTLVRRALRLGMLLLGLGSIRLLLGLSVRWLRSPL